MMNTKTKKSTPVKRIDKRPRRSASSQESTSSDGEPTPSGEAMSTASAETRVLDSNTLSELTILEIVESGKQYLSRDYAGRSDLYMKEREDLVECLQVALGEDFEEVQPFFDQWDRVTGPKASHLDIRHGQIMLIWLLKKVTQTFLREEEMQSSQPPQEPASALGIARDIADKWQKAVENHKGKEKKGKLVITNNPPPIVTEYKQVSPQWRECVTYLRSPQVEDSYENRQNMFTTKVINEIEVTF